MCWFFRHSGLHCSSWIPLCSTRDSVPRERDNEELSPETLGTLTLSPWRGTTMNRRGQGRGTGLGAEVRVSTARMGRSGAALLHRDFSPSQNRAKLFGETLGYQKCLPGCFFWMVGQPLLLLGAFKPGEGGSEPALGGKHTKLMHRKKPSSILCI